MKRIKQVYIYCIRAWTLYTDYAILYLLLVLVFSRRSVRRQPYSCHCRTTSNCFAACTGGLTRMSAPSLLQRSLRRNTDSCTPAMQCSYDASVKRTMRHIAHSTQTSEYFLDLVRRLDIRAVHHTTTLITVLFGWEWCVEVRC